MICNKLLEQGVTPPERRGGARQLEKNKLKSEEIKTFIKEFVPIQGHYCRGKSTARQYLDSRLNIKDVDKSVRKC